MVQLRRFLNGEPPITAGLVDAVQEIARPLNSDHDLDPLMERIGNARHVLIGEASHGTAEFYEWRARITRRLIAERNFSFVAVEGDWPDCYRVNRYVQGLEEDSGPAERVLRSFRRWPTWMWANHEVAGFVGWLHDFNRNRKGQAKVGFYGLDVYSLWDSLYAIMAYLRRHEPDALPVAWHAYRCFEPYGEDVQGYAVAAQLVPDSCEGEVIALLRELLRRSVLQKAENGEARFAAEQNAHVLKNAEAYYRSMVQGGPDAWNIRDRHMTETLERLVDHFGPESKSIVWAHNTHVGDARMTDMAEAGEFNIGQLVRERRGDEGVVLIGFGSYQGTVMAGRRWDAPPQTMRVPPARENSWEAVLHEGSDSNQLLLLDNVTPEMLEPRGHRAIGVVYRPDQEGYGNYVPTVLPRRYDAFLFLTTTSALHPLSVAEVEHTEVPETYPTGV